MRLQILVGGGLGVLTAALAGCPVTSDQPCYGAACGLDGGEDVTVDGPNKDAPDTDGPSTGDGGADADAVADATPDTAPPGCDPAKDPKDSLPCVANTYGLFVDASKPAGGTGTKASPFNTIGAAIAATGTLKRVYVCAGSYGEKVSLDATHDGVSVYGGWSCTDWSYAATNLVSVKPTAGGFALAVSGLTLGTTIEDISFESPAGVAPGDSSIGAFVATSQNVLMRRLSIKAGAGQPGQDGPPLADYSPVKAPDGNPGTAANGGGPQGPGACPNGSGTSVGGAGGQPAGPSGSDGIAGTTAIVPVNPSGHDGAKGTAGTGCAQGLGHDGTYGHGGAPGGAGATTYGVLTASGWTSGSGLAGTLGNVGQGGGGGASQDGSGGGGGGGAGGCGGTGGNLGRGGGSSIALLLFNSKVKLMTSTLSAAGAGKGGNGGIGQKAQLGGGGGIIQVAGECTGGAGGHGGSGGGGGGGAGGLSLGIGWSGTAPNIDGTDVATAATLVGVTTSTFGAKGTAGGGGPAARIAAPASNPGAMGNDGVDGVANAVLGL